MKTPSLVPNLIIAEKYRLVRPLGEGAMGIVWAATNVLTSRKVALKFLVGPDAELRRRMLREARACGALEHRNIVDVLDVARADDGSPVLVMQLLSGETVADLLARTRRLAPERAAAIGRDVASALAAAHSVGVVHRDVKPANIFLHDDEASGEPVVKVLDFGVSKDLRGRDSIHTVPGGVVGSPSYMSPEQARADADIDGRADIWSLGVTLFEMLTGTLPFTGSIEDVLRQIFTVEIPVVSRRMRSVDPRLSDLVARCMERDRDRRFSSAEKVASELDTILRSPAHRGPPMPAHLRPGAELGGAPIRGDRPAGWSDVETLKLTSVAPHVLAPARDHASPPPGIDPHSPSSLAEQGSPPPAADAHLDSGAARPPPGAASSTAPFARAARPGSTDVDPGAPVTPPKSAPARRAARLRAPLAVLGLSAAACALGALLYTLTSSSALPVDASPSSASASTTSASTVPSDAPMITASIPFTSTGNVDVPPPGHETAREEPDAGLGPDANRDETHDETTAPDPDASPRPPLRGPKIRSSATSTAPASPPASLGHGAFDQGVAKTAVGAAAAGAKDCKRPGGTTGPGRARLLFRPDGTVGAVLLDPPYKGTPQGACIEGLFRGVRVPPFTGQTVLVTKSFTIP